MRDKAFEEEFFKNLQQQAEKVGGVSSAHVIIGLAMQRLEYGRQQYGDDDFMRKNLIPHTHQHSADFIVYALLEAQKQHKEYRDGHHYLFQAALHCVIADYYIRLSQR